MSILVDCEWTSWKKGTCSKTCAGGTQTNTRTIKVEARDGGANCTGESVETLDCNTQECPSKGLYRFRF